MLDIVNLVSIVRVVSILGLVLVVLASFHLVVRQLRQICVVVVHFSSIILFSSVAVTWDAGVQPFSKKQVVEKPFLSYLPFITFFHQGSKKVFTHFSKFLSFHVVQNLDLLFLLISAV